MLRNITNLLNIYFGKSGKMRGIVLDILGWSIQIVIHRCKS